jgi:ribose transport system substrate-binding protein
MRLVRFAILPVVLVAALFVAACGGSDNSGSGSSSTQASSNAAPANKGVIAFSVPIASAEFFQGVSYGFEGAAKQLGYSTKILDANLSPDKQVSDLNTFTTQKPKAVVSWTLNPKAAEGAYQQLKTAGVPVLGMGSGSPSFKSSVWVATSPPSGCDSMRTEAQYIAKRVPGAKVLIVGGPPVPTLQAQVACMLKEAKAAGLVVAQKQDNVKNTATAAQSIVQDMLTTHPDARAVWTFNDDSAAGAAAVLASSGKQAWNEDTKKGIIIAGNGGNPATISAIKAGKMTLTMDSDTVLLGIRAAQMAAAAAQGKPLPKQVIIPTKIWDKSNVNTYVLPDKRPIRLTPLPGT